MAIGFMKDVIEQSVSNAIDNDDDFKTLNADMVDAVSRLLDHLGDGDPIEDLLRNNGFSPENGDILIMPGEQKSIRHPNVVFSTFFDGPILMKKPEFTILPKMTIEEASKLWLDYYKTNSNSRQES